LYKYGRNRDINTAAQRQQENTSSAGAAIEQDYFKNQIRALTEELDKNASAARTSSCRTAIMEANAARLRIDTEEMHSPILKPVRTMLCAGRGSTHGSRKRSRRIGL
jgi:hypothetical protein